MKSEDPNKKWYHFDPEEFEKARNGDPKALELTAIHLLKILQRFTEARLSKNDPDLDDIVMTAFLRVWPLKNNVDAKGYPNYCGRVINNLIIDRHRKAWRTILISPIQDGENPVYIDTFEGTSINTPRKMDHDRMLAIAEKEINKQKDVRHQAVIREWMNDETYENMAQRHGYTIGGLSKVIYTFRKRLIETFETQYGVTGL